MRKRRRFYVGELNHVYQKAVNGFNLFYSRYDYLVFYTIFSVCANATDKVTILALCIMRDHWHMLVFAESREALSSFEDHYSFRFVREFNDFVGRKGRLLKKNFGSAPKKGDKAVRTAISYVENNPVEKHLCKLARDYRWNFLAYVNNRWPFSEKVNLMTCRRCLRRSMKEVDAMLRQNLPLKYMQLKRMFSGLNEMETEQLTDYIISSYLMFDYETLISYFGSYEKMIMAIDSNTGSEYDIKEDYNPYSDKVYDDMMAYMQRSMSEIDVRKVIMAENNIKKRFCEILQNETAASVKQLRKFLHITDGA